MPGAVVFLPRIKRDIDDTIASRLPFTLHRRRFLIVLAFAMTINISQGLIKIQ